MAYLIERHRTTEWIWYWWNRTRCSGCHCEQRTTTTMSMTTVRWYRHMEVIGLP